ncbi:uncharacterized protein [Drosophila kikkawai]|uniref:Uncharacterized protein LOC108082213 n=1 Tax=Drosophila kikkawai TaxID=30033 RepID=A0A6P4IVG3_DROKI|nr:uncharacterized protein LOC108082213 [Drosophila kikkawai]XP_041631686.1 uncharacterized protein LOC108082213 [Drosophila kikkawai]
MASLQIPPERHFGFECCNCTVANFPGRRYSCGVCPGYNLCGDCFDTNLVPEDDHHLYYHPMKVHYTRAAFQLYFQGETYSADSPSFQSYKCALCELRGLTSGALYKHLSEVHLTHPDYDEYAELVSAYNETERMSPAELRQNRELGLQERLIEFVLSPEQSGRSHGLSLAQLLVQMKRLSITAPEFPHLCVRIMKRAHWLQAQQKDGEMEKAVQKYVSQIEHEVATGLCERRLRLDREATASVRLNQRNGATSIVPASNGPVGMHTAATPTALVTNRTLYLNALRELEAMDGNEDTAMPCVVGPGKYRQALLSSKPPKVSQDTQEDQQEQNKIPDNERFLCSQFLVDRKPPPNRSRVVIKQLQANFVEAILCSMLADEELIPLPMKPLCLDAKKTQLMNTKRFYFPLLKLQTEKKISPMEQPFMKEMFRFYKGLDKYKAKMDKPNESFSTDENGAESSLINSDSNSNGDFGVGSGMLGNGNESLSTVNPEIQEPGRLDSELLELNMARIIEGIGAIMDENDGF